MTSRTHGPLATMLKTDFEPASNMRGRLSFADVRYLLPELRTGRILHLGLPGGLDVAGFLDGLQPGAAVTLLSSDPEVTAAVSVEMARRDSGRVEVDCLACSSWGHLPLGSRTASLAVVGTGPGSPLPSDGPRLASQLRRVVEDGGAMALEAVGYRGAARVGEMVEILTAAGFEACSPLWLLTVSGSLRMAVEEGDLDSARHLLAWLGRGASSRRLGFRIAVDLLDRSGLLAAFLARRRLFILRKLPVKAGGVEAAPSSPPAPSTESTGRRTGPPAPGGALGGPTDGANGRRPAARSSNGRRAGAGAAGTAAEAGSWPPPYLRSVLVEAGLVPERYRFGFHVHGRYDSNKVAFFLFDRNGRGEPRHMVKATRASRFNYRLENEHRSLAHLRERRYLPSGALPRPIFLAHRGGLAMLGLDFVPGRPMREMSRADPDCRWVRRVVHHLESLGVASARRDRDAADVLRTGLEHFYRRFVDIYPVPSAKKRLLRSQMSALQEGAETLPTVFQHGDAGIWNVLVDGEDAVLLDWEVGEPAGMPLWDLYYFLRSVGSWSSRLRREKDLVRSYEEHFLQSSPLGRFQERVVERYRHRLGIDPALVEPLLHTCWMHRALRQAMQMERDAVEKGVYYRLLLRSIRFRSGSPGARRP